jgi:HSP20 family protein
MNQVTTHDYKNGTVPSRAYRRHTASPPVDIFENVDEVLVIADVPGVPSDGIDLRVENDTLTLSARRPGAKDGGPALVREYDDVDFAATFRIPAGIDASGITAETKNGTLVIRLPKVAAAKPRQIVVRPKSGH